MSPTVADYVVGRIADLGVSHVFGVPGDYSFPFNNAVEADDRLTWIGAANELNAAYAADGYARVRGVAMLCTTYAVGELSALNGVMGSKAERLPVFHLVGAPSARLERARYGIHHSHGDGDYGQFRALSAAAACTSAVLTPANAIAETERVITEALAHRQPAYLTVAQDHALMPVVGQPIAGVLLESVPRMPSNPQELDGAVRAILARLSDAQSPIVLAAHQVARFGLRRELDGFLRAAGLPYLTSPMDKSTLSETHPNFLGMLNGILSGPGVYDAVASSDLLLDIGGMIFSDFNTFAWTNAFERSRVLSIRHDCVEIGDVSYGPVDIGDVLTELTAEVQSRVMTEIAAQPTVPPAGNPADQITSPQLYPRIREYLRPSDVLIVETGSASANLAAIPLPADCDYHNQVLWGSIGWATPAALGSALADPLRRTVLVTGDGSHQLTANEIGVMGRYGASPTIIVLNNGVYGVEERLNSVRGQSYDDLALWEYSAIPAAMGCTDWYTARVETLAELDAALNTAATCGTASYIEVVLPHSDIPASEAPEILDVIYKTSTPNI